jgi:KamA family protein
LRAATPTTRDLDGILTQVENVNETVYAKFAIAVTPYMAQLMDRDDPNCPIRLQYLPSHHEETKPGFATMLDQLGEEGDTIPGTSVVHRYPRRVLFLVSNTCATLCRFCTRKRMVSQPTGSVHKDEIERLHRLHRQQQGHRRRAAVRRRPADLHDERLDYILGELRRRAPHVRFLRMGSRMVVQMPTRVTPELCAVLEKHRVQMVNIHINHPKEITPLLRQRVKLLQKAGIMMGLQTVCLKGVNDSVEVMRELFMQSIEMGVRPTTCTPPTWWKARTTSSCRTTACWNCMKACAAGSAARPCPPSSSTAWVAWASCPSSRVMCAKSPCPMAAAPPSSAATTPARRWKCRAWARTSACPARATEIPAGACRRPDLTPTAPP